MPLAGILSFREAADTFKAEQKGLVQTPAVTFPGMPWLHSAVGAVGDGSMVTVAGRTGTGKSFFGVQLLAACEERGLYVSLEDPIREVGRRVSALPKDVQARLFVAAPFSPRLSGVMRTVRDAVEQHGVRVVVIDYLQLLAYDGGVGAWSLADQIHHTINDLKALARETGFVLVLCAQVRRPSFNYEDVAPSLAELKDSSSIENSSELVILIHEDDQGLVVARIGKSKTSARSGRQVYTRNAKTGWLEEADERELYEDAA